MWSKRDVKRWLRRPDPMGTWLLRAFVALLVVLAVLRACGVISG